MINSQISTLLQTAINNLQVTYEVQVEMKHKHIYEVWQDGFPLFRLILGQHQSSKDFLILVSFQIELPIPAAIEWYMRVTQEIPEVTLTDSYIENLETGQSMVGEDAHAFVLAQTEQQILSHLKESSDKAPVLETSTKTGYADFVKLTLRKFDAWDPKNGSTEN